MTTPAGGRPDALRLESELVELVAAAHPNELVACWVSAASRLADLARMLEAVEFPEMPELMAEHEANALFLLLVDTRSHETRVVHVMRLSSTVTDAAGRRTGPALVDDLIASGQGLTWTTVTDYFRRNAIEHSRCIAVESNFRVGAKIDTPSGVPAPDLGYLAIYSRWQELGGRLGESVLFAHVNRPALISFQRIGFEVRPAFGLAALRTPSVGESWDDDYRPVEIPFSEANASLFDQLLPFTPPTMVID